MQNFEQQFPVVKFDPQMEVTPIPWLIRGLWQKGKINGIAGYEKSGKSRLLGWILSGLYHGSSNSVLGLDIVGYQVVKPHVLYLCGEETKEVVNQRLLKYAGLQGVDPEKIDVDFMEAAGMRLELKPQRDALLEYILNNNYDLIVMDPMRRLHTADEDKSTQMAPIYNDIRRWSNRHGVTILLVHHTGKVGDDTDMSRIANWFRGSTDLAAILDCATYVQRTTKTTVAVHRHGRFEPLPNLIINDLSDGKGFERKA